MLICCSHATLSKYVFGFREFPRLEFCLLKMILSLCTHWRVVDGWCSKLTMAVAQCLRSLGIVSTVTKWQKYRMRVSLNLDIVAYPHIYISNTGKGLLSGQISEQLGHA